MKYLKQFENNAAYEAAESGLILPNVSLIADTNKVEYNPYVDPYGGHEYVDLGLPSGTKWSTMNVGANSVTDYGNYYKYGLGANQYDSGQSTYTGMENPLAITADTAVQVWGGSWHMPTKTQFEELTANTTYEWTTIDGINGGKFTAQNNNYVFFPAAGIEGKYSIGSLGRYFSSTPKDSNAVNGLVVNNSSGSVSDDFYRGNGFSIRPVVG